MHEIDNAYRRQSDGGGENRIEEADLLVRDHAVRNHHDGAEDGEEGASPGAVKEQEDRRAEQHHKNQQIPVPRLNREQFAWTFDHVRLKVADERLPRIGPGEPIHGPEDKHGNSCSGRDCRNPLAPARITKVDHREEERWQQLKAKAGGQRAKHSCKKEPLSLAQSFAVNAEIKPGQQDVGGNHFIQRFWRKVNQPEEEGAREGRDDGRGRAAGALCPCIPKPDCDERDERENNRCSKQVSGRRRA